MRKRPMLKLVAGLRDLQIVDCDGINCGIVDDVELAGEAGESLEVCALLVGAGGRIPRLPAWMRPLARRLGGDAIVRIPWAEVESVTSRVTLRRRAEALGLGGGERRARAWLPRIGGLV